MDDRTRRPAGGMPQRELQLPLVRAVEQLRSTPLPHAVMKRVLDKVRCSPRRSSLWLRTLLRGEIMPN
jgi:hypothetical protein